MSNQAQHKEPERLGVIVKRIMEKIERERVPENAPKVHPKLGTHSAAYVYVEETGAPSLVVYRYDNCDNSDKSHGKEFRPFDLKSMEWRAPYVRPLYRHNIIAAYPGTAPIVLVEGEKCADALNDLGILATCAFGGCNGIGKADLSPLKGRHVVIWPDNDEPGAKYADRAALSLREIGAASVTIVPFDALRDKPQGWDAADAVRDGWSVERILAFINTARSLKASDPLRDRDAEPKRTLMAFGPLRVGALREPANDDTLKLKEDAPALKLKEEEWGEPDMSVLNPRPKPPEFPTYLFGPFWSKWLTEQAQGKSTPVDYVAGTLLVTASTAIGNSRRVSPWKDWNEPVHLWAALVGNPSSGKSPAMDPVMDMIRQIEAEEAKGHAEALRQYEADVIAAKYVRDQWEKDVKAAAQEGFPPPLKPEAAMEPVKPHRPRLRVSDATPEALLSLLSQLSRGILMTRDELAGWLGSFNRYAGGEGGDRAFWLEAWGGRSYTVDRVKNDQPMTIPHLSISVLGGIQPDKLANMLLKGDDDGLTARFMYFWPDPVPLERPSDTPDTPEALNALKALHGLPMGMDEHGNACPIIARLTEEAAAFFHVWRVEHNKNEPKGALLGWWGKMPGLCLRLAITYEGLWNAVDGKGLDQVCKQAVEAATVFIGEYLKPMAARAFGDSALTDQQRNAATLAKWILKNRPQRINTRELIRGEGTPTFRKANEIKGSIEVLVSGEWLHAAASRKGYQKGRWRMDYSINPSVYKLCGSCH